MKKLSLIIFISFAVTYSNEVKSQDIPATLTVAGLQQLANGVIGKLTTAGTTLLGEGSTVINGASSQVSVLLTQFDRMTQNDITTPIRELSSDIKNLANQLYSISNRLNTILNQQQACLFLNSQIIIASVQSIVSEVKNGIPVISKDGPRLSYFQFDGHTPSVVPLEGGRIEIDGFNLWNNENLPPIVTIVNEGETKVILSIVPQRASNNNNFSFFLSPSFIHQNSGKCLQIKVQPRTKKWFQTKVLGDFYLPICIPSNYSLKVKLVAHLQYPCITTRQKTLEFKQYTFDNTNCDRVSVAPLQMCWVMPPNAQILSYIFRPAVPNQPGQPHVWNNTGIGVTYAANCITAAGWLDGATCRFGKRTHSTFWDAGIAPVISYPDTAISIADASSNYLNFGQSITNLCVNLPKSCPGNLGNVFWFEIVQTNGTEMKTLYTSSRATDNPLHDDYNGFTIDASLNPIPVRGQAQLCVQIKRPICGL